MNPRTRLHLSSVDEGSCSLLLCFLPLIHFLSCCCPLPVMCIWMRRSKRALAIVHPCGALVHNGVVSVCVCGVHMCVLCADMLVHACVFMPALAFLTPWRTPCDSRYSSGLHERISWKGHRTNIRTIKEQTDDGREYHGKVIGQP